MEKELIGNILVRILGALFGLGVSFTGLLISLFGIVFCTSIIGILAGIPMIFYGIGMIFSGIILAFDIAIKGKSWFKMKNKVQKNLDNEGRKFYFIDAKFVSIYPVMVKYELN